MPFFICKKFGHVKSQCWYRTREANVLKEEKEKEKEKEEEEGVAFMAICEEPKKKGGTWLIDSGCSNHMKGEKILFQHIEDTPSCPITVGDGKTLKVEGIGSVNLCSSNGKITTLNGVQFVPSLAHNLLSVEQMMDSGFDEEFTKGV